MKTTPSATISTRRPLDIPSVKYIVDYQLARGINFFEFMFWPSKKGPAGYMAEPGMKELNDYVNRACYMMQQGRPSARVALYAPIPSLWLGNNRAYDYMKAAAHMLTSHQYDFDFITDDGLTEAVTASNGTLTNGSGQTYTTLVIPYAETVSQKAWERIKEFAARGGKVIHIGGAPATTYERTLTDTQTAAPIASALHVADSTWTQQMEQYLPERELTVVEGRADSIAYCAREAGGRRIFFVLNQRGEKETLTIDLDCMGQPELWDAATGEVAQLPFTVVGRKTRVNLPLSAWQSKIIVVTRRTAEYRVGRKDKIQDVINRAQSEGGGTVVVPSGKHATGALFFPRGVNLHLERGARLVSIPDTTLYPYVATRWEGRMVMARAALLNFDRNEGCRLTGEGLIDAQGLKWKKKKLRFYDRPKTICFDRCDGGGISGVNILNQAFWCLHILYTDSFTVDGVNICAEKYIPSSDGIDIDSSTRIAVRNTHIKAHDDCISIKSGKDSDGRRVNKASENITIEGCHFDYGHGGVAIGSEVSGDVRHVAVRRCDMAGENWNPIRIKSQPSRGGVVEDILFEDIDIGNARNVMEINMTWRMKGAEEPPYKPLTQLRGIRLRNVTAHAKAAGEIRGFEEQHIPRGAITFENCRFDVAQPLRISNADIDLQGLQVNITE